MLAVQSLGRTDPMGKPLDDLITGSNLISQMLMQDVAIPGSKATIRYRTNTNQRIQVLPVNELIHESKDHEGSTIQRRESRMERAQIKGRGAGEVKLVGYKRRKNDSLGSPLL